MAQNLTARTDQPLQTALSASSRKCLVSCLTELTNADAIRTLLTMTPHGLRSWLAGQRKKLGPAATPAQIQAQLAKLIPHYWTPDLTEAQMRSKFQDFCCDLEGVSVAGIEQACIAYRRDPKSEFFPKPGQLLALCKDDIAERKRTVRALGEAERIVEEQPQDAAEATLDEQTIARRKAMLEGVIGRTVSRESCSRDDEPEPGSRAQPEGEITPERRAQLRDMAEMAARRAGRAA